MPSFKQAVALCRTRGELPAGAPVSWRSLIARYRPEPAGSMRALFLIMEGLKPTIRWGIVIVTITGVPRTTSLPPDWFHQLFNDGDGVGPFFRHTSGHRQIFSWRVFGPMDLYTPTKKAELVQAGAAAESKYLREAAKNRGVPVGDFDRFLWVIDQPGSGGTSGNGDIFIAAADITPQITTHEMGHTLGNLSEGNSYHNGVVQVYGDVYCPMDNGPSARSFQNHRLQYTADHNNHQTSGPVFCAPHLMHLSWLDYSQNVKELPLAPSTTDLVLPANRGGPPPGDSRRVAITLGRIPGAGDASQWWLEYRAPLGFDRWVDRATSTNTIDMPHGALVLHELRSDRHAVYVANAPASPGNSISIPNSKLVALIRLVDSTNHTLTIRIT